MKFVRVFARVIPAAIVGWLIRISRRLRKLPPRVWYGPAPLHGTRDNVRAGLLAGYPSRSVTMHARPLPYDLVTRREFDLVLDSPDVPWDEKAWVALADLLRHGDIWSAYFDSLFFDRGSFRRNAIVLRLLRLLGIRIVVMPHGSDIVQLMPEATRYDWIGHFQRDYPAWDFREQTPLSRKRVELFSKYADMVIAADTATRRLMTRADLTFKPYAIDCDALQPSPAAARDVPVIIHAPNHRLVKGTDSLLEALERIRAAGIPFDLRLIERVAREEALQRYREADIIADQFRIGAFGVFALEASALGKPVLVYLDEEQLGNPVFNIASVNTTPDNLPQVLAPMLLIPELRHRIGAEARRLVATYFSLAALAEVWDAIYRHIWWGTALALQQTKHFSPERTARSLSEDPSQPEFWPVPVDDLMSEIRAAISRLS